MDLAISFCEWFLTILVHGRFYSFDAFFGRVRASILYFSCKFSSFGHISSAFFVVAEALLHQTPWVVCSAHGSLRFPCVQKSRIVVGLCRFRGYL